MCFYDFLKHKKSREIDHFGQKREKCQIWLILDFSLSNMKKIWVCRENTTCTFLWPTAFLLFAWLNRYMTLFLMFLLLVGNRWRTFFLNVLIHENMIFKWQNESSIVNKQNLKQRHEHWWMFYFKLFFFLTVTLNRICVMKSTELQMHKTKHLTVYAVKALKTRTI